jgi:hypothetical protein
MMRLRAWNAFASNNSGSYTIVGRFPDEGTASAVAEELAALVAKHAQWFEGQGHQRWDAEERSPLEQLADAEGIDASNGIGRSDDWPQYGPPPEVVAVGAQVVLHVDYTVTMPPLFGELMYRRGGRVDVELDHSHGPEVWVHEVWWPWQGRDEAAVKAGQVQLLDALFAEGGPLRTQVLPSQPPSWSDGGGKFGHADLSLAAAWCEPMVAIPRVRALAESVGARARLRVMEAIDLRDPAGLFRPCWPWPSDNLVDLVIEQLGDAPQEVRRRLAEEVLYDRGGGTASSQAVARLVAQCPTTVAWALPRAVAEACAATLGQAGARVRLADHEYPERLVACVAD